MVITISDIGNGQARIILNHKLARFAEREHIDRRLLIVNKAVLLAWMDSITRYVNNELHEECLFEVE